MLSLGTDALSGAGSGANGVRNGIETCGTNTAPPDAFSVLLMSQLNRDLPSILIQSQYPDLGLKVLADHVQREIPVLLLDTRERLSDDGKGTAAKTELAKRAKTFPVFERKDVQEMCLMSPDGGELCVQSRIKIIELGLEALRRESSAFCDERVLNGYSASTLSFLRRLASGLRIQVGMVHINPGFRASTSQRTSNQVPSTNRVGKSVGPARRFGCSKH